MCTADVGTSSSSGSIRIKVESMKHGHLQFRRFFGEDVLVVGVIKKNPIGTTGFIGFG